MSYLGGFMGGSPDYNGNPGILGLYQFVQSGYDAGKAKAQNQALSQLAQKAYTDTGDAQKQDIAQAIGIDPTAGYALAGKAQEQNAAQQAQKLAAFQRLGKAASAIIQAKQAGDETTAEGIYQAIVPELGLMSAQHGGPTPPPTLQGADMGALYKVAAMYASLPQPPKPISVGPDTTLLDGATHKVIYQGAGDAGAVVPGLTRNGMPVFRDKMGHLKDVFGNPIPQGAVQGGVGVGQTGAGAPTGLPAETEAYVPKVTAALNGQPAFDQFGQPTAALLDAIQKVESNGNSNAVSPTGAQGAYQFMPATAASVGVTDPFDPQQARQGAAKYLAQLYQQFGGDANKAIAAYNAGPGRVQQASAPQQGGGLQYSAGGNKHVSTLSAQEVAALGLPAGTIAQRSPDGTLRVVSKPGSGGLFGDDGANSFTPEAQQLLAVATEQGLKIPIPSVGMGGAARVQFVNGLAKDINEKHIPLDLALQEMRFGLDADPGLKKSQGLYSTTKTLEAGADNLAQQAIDLAGSVGRGQIPLFNAWVNAGRRATGDPDIARFDRAINAFVNDYAKVVSGSLGSAAASDSSRKQAEEQLTAAQSPEQFAASVQQMQKEMHVRTDGMLNSIRQQVANITSGGVRTGAPTFGAGQQPAPAAGAMPTAVNPQTGERVQWNGSAWVPLQ